MGIKESALAAITSITQSDFIRAVTTTGASRRITTANLSKEIIEHYTGSTLGGAARSIKTAIDEIKEAVTNRAPGLSKEAFIELATDWDLRVDKYIKYGNLISIEVLITPPEPIAVGTLATVGTVKEAFRPVAMASIGGGSLNGYIWTNGDFRVRSITGAAVTTQQRMGLLYIIK